jgi:hypothetical protein
MSLFEDLGNEMDNALLKAPRPVKMTQVEYARHVLDALALKALQRAEHRAEIAEMGRKAEAEAIANGQRFYVCHPYDGLAVDIKPGEQAAFAAWASIDQGDVERMLAGKQEKAGDWVYDNTQWHYDPHGNYLRHGQLAQRYIPQPVKSGAIRIDSNRLTRAMPATVYVDWRDMTYQAALKYAADKRQPLPAGAIIASA